MRVETMKIEKSVIPTTTGSGSPSGTFSFMPQEGYSFWPAPFLSAQKSPTFLIGRASDICGGAPIILGTRLSVHQIVEQYETLHWEKESLLKAYPHITSQQLDAALEYYKCHREEIEDLIEEERAAEVGP